MSTKKKVNKPKPLRPCRDRDEVYRFSVFGKCLHIATETRRVNRWPPQPNGKKFGMLFYCANCAARFDDMVSEFRSEAAYS